MLIFIAPVDLTTTNVTRNLFKSLSFDHSLQVVKEDEERIFYKVLEWHGYAIVLRIAVYIIS